MANSPMNLLGIKQRHLIFRQYVPTLYDLFIEQPLAEWPSLTVEWLPSHRGVAAGVRQLLLGTQTGKQEPNMLKVMEVQLQPEEEAFHNHLSSEGEDQTGAIGEDCNNDGQTQRQLGHIDIDQEESQSQDHNPTPRSTIRTRRRCQTYCFPHPPGADAVDRARYMPQHPHLVATKCADQGLYLFDISPALEGQQAAQHTQMQQQQQQQQLRQQHGGGITQGGSGVGASSAQGNGISVVREGAYSIEYMCGGPLGSLGKEHGRGSNRRKTGSSADPAPSGFGLCWSPFEPGRLLSTCNSGAIQHVRLDTSPSSLAPYTASGSIGLPSLGIVRYQRDAHSGGVNDVAFPASAQGFIDSALPGCVYASCGEDGFLKLWDDRSSGHAVCVHAHAGHTANSVAFSSKHIIATGGSDGKIKLFDLRALSVGLSQGAAAATLPKGPTCNGSSCNAGHGACNNSDNKKDGLCCGMPTGDMGPFCIFGSHKCAVNQVSWSPDWPNFLASADADNRVFVWDIDRSHKSLTDFTSPPQLRAMHVGHVADVYDISWSSNAHHGDNQPAGQRPRPAPLLASVSPTFWEEDPEEEDHEAGELEDGGLKEEEDKAAEDGGAEEQEGKAEERVVVPLLRQRHVLHVYTPAADMLQLGQEPAGS